MRALKAVSLSGGELKELHIHHLCETLWDALYRSGKGVFRWDAQSPVHDLSGYRVQAMMQYIRRQYAQHIYLADIAAAAHVSKSEALRCFRATVHTTPVEYLIEYRLATAARILKTENMKISDVAERVGFENISYFCRVFKRKYGLSPGQYRLNIRRRSL